MPNDAKLGLVIGVGLVVVVAVVFFRKDLAASTGFTPEKAAVSTYRPPVSTYRPPVSTYRPPVSTYRPPVSSNPALRPATNRTRPALAKGRTMSRNESGSEAKLADRRHTVEDGDTLFTLAQRYYGDGDKFIDLYRANRDMLKSPDGLVAGTELVIPNLTEEKAKE